MSSPSRSGAFEVEVDKRVEQFTESISFDHRMFEQDIDGSLAHARMLASQGLLADDECRQICDTLESIRQEIRSGRFEFSPRLEDIHMNIEQSLIDRLGDVGRKLHTARSRNDQSSTDTRLWIRDRIDRLDGQLARLQAAFVEVASREQDTIIPAYTHLQRAQPVLAAHYCLAFCEKFARDRQRLADCRKRVNCCSLGTAAVAGTSLPIDRQSVANELGFEGWMMNSLDASSDRDYVLETVFCLSLVGIHLSNWAEDWIIWSTTEFDFIQLPQEFCTGSSIMPQKVNPDVLELIRGKTARVIGDLQTLLVLLKGLPMAYNRDLQEDKPPLFDACDTVGDCLELAAAVVSGVRFRHAAIARRIEEGYLDSTTLMEYLIRQGRPQRRAHHLVGQIVRHAIHAGKQLAELSLAELREFDSELDDSIYHVLGTQNAVAAFRSVGSSNPARVAEQISQWKQRLGV